MIRFKIKVLLRSLSPLLSLLFLVSAVHAQNVVESELMKANPHLKSDLWANSCATEHFFGPVEKVVQIDGNFDTVPVCQVIFTNNRFYSKHYRWYTVPFDTVVYELASGKVYNIVARSTKISAYYKAHLKKKDTRKSSGYIRVGNPRRLQILHKEQQSITTTYLFTDTLPVVMTTSRCGEGTYDPSTDDYDEVVIYDSLKRPQMVLKTKTGRAFPDLNFITIIEKAYVYSYNIDNHIIKEEVCEFPSGEFTEVPDAYEKYVKSATSYIYENGVCTKSIDDKGFTTDLSSLEVEKSGNDPIYYRATEYPYVASFFRWHSDACNHEGIGYFVTRIAYAYDAYGNILTVTYELLDHGFWEERWEYAYDEYGNWLTRNYFVDGILHQSSRRTVTYAGKK